MKRKTEGKQDLIQNKTKMEKHDVFVIFMK